jgi:hypothetical protein
MTAAREIRVHPGAVRAVVSAMAIGCGGRR